MGPKAGTYFEPELGRVVSEILLNTQRHLHGPVGGKWRVLAGVVGGRQR